MNTKKKIKWATAGYTLNELLIALPISGLVITTVITTFMWCGEQATLCSKIAWSQTAAMNSAAKIMAYVRNASEIVSIDEEEGKWVELRFPDGKTGKLVYSNAVPFQRDGKLYLQRNNGTEMIITRGMTEIQEGDGFTTPVFTRTRDNSLRIAYRLSEPTSKGARAVDDAPFAAIVRLGACLRNATKPDGTAKAE